MVRLEVKVTPDELFERMSAAERQGVSLSDHLRMALGMRPFGDPPMFHVESKSRRRRLRLVHGRTQTHRRG
jgi:hypothetical protein